LTLIFAYAKVDFNVIKITQQEIADNTKPSARMGRKA